MTQAANDDAAPGDDTISGEDAVALWPQSIRPGVSQGAPQAAPAKPGQTDAGKTDPGKTDKDSKQDVADTGVEPDAATALAANTPPADQQPVTAAAAIVPHPSGAAPQIQAPLQTDAAAPAIQPPAQPAAPQAPALPQDPAMLQPAGQEPVGQQAAAEQPAPQNANQIADRAVNQAADQIAAQMAGQTPPAAAPLQVAATPVVSAPDTALPVQDKIATDKTAAAPITDQLQQAAPQPDASKPGALQPGAKTQSFKPANDTGKQADSDPATVKSADSASVQADQVRQPELPKPAAPTPDTGFKAADTAITPAAVSSAAPQASGASITQHIQVTAQPREATPNLPALAVEIAGKSQSGAKQFDIRLDPPELGRVEVRLSIDATGKASAHLSADQPQTLSLLQKDAHVLTRALRDAGLDVSQDGLNFSLRQQQDNGAGAQSNQSGGRSGRGFALTATTSLEATASSAAYSGAADGHLDIRV